MKKTLLLVLCAGCGLIEFRIGEKQGIKPVTGEADVAIRGFECGQPLSADGYVVTSQVSGSDCRITVERDVVVATKDDYSRIDGLNDVANLVKAVELEVRALSFGDLDNEATLSLDQVREARLSVNGQVVLTRDELRQLPRTVRLEGRALDSLRAQMDARETCTVHLTAMVVVRPPLPQRLGVHYDVQPVLVLGPR